MRDLHKPLAFAGREVEVLDVLIPNLVNQMSLQRESSFKYHSPVAAQPPGMGKTALGKNITAVLRRPREADKAAEAAIAERLRSAGGVISRLVDAALADSRDENLVVRALIAHFPCHEKLILDLKRVDPLVLKMNSVMTLMTGLGFNLDAALAYGIFCAARKLSGFNPKAHAAFLARCSTLQTARGIVYELIEERGGAPVMLVLDNIAFMMEHRDNFSSDPGQHELPLHRAMSSLSLELQLLHGIPGCLIFSTGLLLWESCQVLIDSGQLFVRSTVLRPLSPDDITDALQPILRSVAVAPELVESFSSRVAALTGGGASAVYYLLRARQRAVLGGAPVLTSREEVRKALERLMPQLPEFPGMLLRVSTVRLETAISMKEIPAWAQQKEGQARLLQLFARMLLLDASFMEYFAIGLRGEQLRLTDAAVALGLSYCPAPVPSGEFSWILMRLRLLAGDWLCGSIASEFSIRRYPSVLASAQLLVATRSLGGSMRGRPFEMLCAEALCYRSLLAPGQALAQLLPHLSRSVLASDVVPALRVVALPKAVRDDASLPRLDDASKAALLGGSRERWTGATSVHAQDLPWILAQWLPVGSLGVSASAGKVEGSSAADAQPGSQDFFVRLSGGVLCVAVEGSTDLGSLRDAMDRAPAFPCRTPSTRVLWSLHLAPQLRAAVGDADAALYGEGRWGFSGALGGMACTPVSGAGVELAFEKVAVEPAFVVGTQQELVLVNPHAPRGGLAELLGTSVLQELAAMCSTTTGHIPESRIVDWMASGARSRLLRRQCSSSAT